VTCGSFVRQAACVLVDQATQDRFSADLSCVDDGHGGSGNVRLVVGDALGDALVRSGGVVVHLVVGQDGSQVCLAEDQDPVEELSAQGADQAFAGRVMRGAWTAVRRILAPAAWKMASKERVKSDPPG
jgi:hypothetical protein